MYDFVPVAKMLTVVPVVKICLPIALYLVVNGPEKVQDSMSFTMNQYILWLLLAIADPALECKM